MDDEKLRIRGVHVTSRGTDKTTYELSPPDICKGCGSYNFCTLLRFENVRWAQVKPKIKLIKDCPCHGCLVMSLCSQECDDYIDFMDIMVVGDHS